MHKEGLRQSAAFSSPTPPSKVVSNGARLAMEDLIISEFRRSDFFISIVELIEAAKGTLSSHSNGHNLETKVKQKSGASFMRFLDYSDEICSDITEGTFDAGYDDRLRLVDQLSLATTVELPVSKPNGGVSESGFSEGRNALYIDNVRFDFSTEIGKSADLDFDGITQEGPCFLANPYEDDNESNASYTDKEGDRLGFSIEDGSLIMHVNGKRCAGCDDGSGVVKKLTYTPGQPADVRTQHGWGSSDMPWFVVRKLKKLADRAGVAHNLPDFIPTLASAAALGTISKDFDTMDSSPRSQTKTSGKDSSFSKGLTRSQSALTALRSTALMSFVSGRSGKEEHRKFSGTSKASKDERPEIMRHCSVSSKKPTARERKMWMNRDLFVDVDELKAGVRKSVIRDKMTRDLLREDGCCQKIVRSVWFEYCTFLAVPLNVLWVALDTDMNTAKSPGDAMAFLVVDMLFAVFFFGEWLLRLLAFQNKKEGLKDRGFMFDTIITIFLVLDLALALFASTVDSLANASVLKIVRLVRFVRVARLTRIMRSMPEVMVLMKGIGVAARSAFFTLIVLILFMFVFALAFRQLTDGTRVGDKYFRNVPAGMYSLALYATLPDMADIVDNVWSEHVLLGIIMMSFILGASLIILNLLVGLLVEVVKVVSQMEKEERVVWSVKTKLASILKKQGWQNIEEDESLRITRGDFIQLIRKPQAARALEEIGVESDALIDNVEIVFQADPERGLSFPELIELVMQLRGSNTCRVKDIIDLRKFMFSELERVEELLKYHTAILENRSSNPGKPPKRELNRNSSPRKSTHVLGGMFFSTCSSTMP